MNIAANASKPRQDKALLRSCEPCRNAKARCVPSADPNIKECERCLKYHKNCVYAEAQPRPKRGKQTHTRVAEVEKKLDNIYALLQANRHPESTSASTNNPQAQAPSPVSSPEQNGSTDSPFVLKTTPPQIQQLTPPYSDGHGEFRRRIDVIDKGVLSEKEAEDLLRVYQDASRDYPFVYVDPTTTLEALRWEKPFLLLSILVMASPRARSLQVLLEKELRELLANKVIVEGELSLDLLQGLLIYLAWYHFNFRPCRQQLYQLTQLAVSMVVDLEIGRPAKEKTGFVLHPVRACMACKRDTALPIMSETEAKRTFVGAYYLTAALSTVLRKPNGMAYTKYVEQCCLDLAEVKEAPADEHLIHYIHIQRIAEEVGIMFGYSDFVDQARLSPERIQLSVRAFMANLQEIEKGFSPEVRAMPSIMNLYYSTCSYTHEVILHVDLDISHSPPSPSSSTPTLPTPLLPLPHSHSQSWTSSTTRTDLLLGCLESLKTTLTYYASLPLLSIERFTLLDLARLSYNLLLLGRLTLSGGPGFNSDIFRQTIDVIEYFDLFNARFAALVELQGGEPSRTIYWHFQRVFGNARSWFGARIERGKKDLAAEESGGKAGTQAGRGHMGRNLSPFSLLDPEEEENICRRMKDAGFSEERIQMHRHAQQGRGGGEMGDMVNVGGSELLHIPGHGQAACGDVMGAGVTANGGGEGGMENIWGAGAGGTEGRNPNAAVDVDVDGVMGMQDGLWEEMMAVWPMSMDGSVLF